MPNKNCSKQHSGSFENFFIFSEKISKHFMSIVCLADDSHEMSRPIFSEKSKLLQLCCMANTVRVNIIFIFTDTKFILNLPCVEYKVDRVVLGMGYQCTYIHQQPDITEILLKEPRYLEFHHCFTLLFGQICLKKQCIPR